MQYGDIRPQLSNNRVKSMGVGICRDASAAVFVAGGGVGKSPEKKCTRTNK